jgi:hypothetical protein
VTYDTVAHTATVTSITGVGSETGATVGTVDVSGTTHTNAGDYPSDPWTFTDATGNYNNANGTVHDAIDKATATVNVTPYSVTYDAAAHTATGTATGVLGETLSGLDLSGTTHTNAGDYPSDPWTFTDATGNYNNASGSVHDHIDKADAVISVTAYSVPHDGNPHTAVGTAVGVAGEDLNGLLNLGGTTHTNIGDYPADGWTFTGNGNYNPDAGTVHDRITYLTGMCLGEPGHQVLSPLSPSMITPSTAKRNSTVPVKFRVCDAAAHSIGTPGVVTNFAIVGVTGGTSAEDLAPQSTTPDTMFRWDPIAQQWIFNLSTKNLTAGFTYIFEIDLNDGSNIVFKLGVK